MQHQHRLLRAVHSYQCNATAFVIHTVVRAAFVRFLPSMGLCHVRSRAVVCASIDFHEVGWNRKSSERRQRTISMFAAPVNQSMDDSQRLRTRHTYRPTQFYSFFFSFFYLFFRFSTENSIYFSENPPDSSIHRAMNSSISHSFPNRIHTFQNNHLYKFSIRHLLLFLLLFAVAASFESSRTHSHTHTHTTVVHQTPEHTSISSSLFPQRKVAEPPSV